MTLKHTLGWLDRAPERSIWFVAETTEEAAFAAAIAANIGDRFGRLTFYMSGPAARPPLLPAPRPARLQPALRLALSQLRCRVVILPHSPSKFGASLAEAAHAMGLAALPTPESEEAISLFTNALKGFLRANPRNSRTPIWSNHLATRLNRPIPSQAALSVALGQPKSILCLGSGPSSNDGRAVDAAANADAVFRVKHRWLTEGRIKRADAVFSGTVETVRRVPGAILLAQDAQTAARVAASALLRGRRIAYGVVEQLAPGFEPVDRSGARMTNGAAMLAMAVALKPDRLTIAGVDLYVHPDGAYPDAPETANAYAPAHDRDIEQTHTLAMLHRQIEQSGPQSLRVIGPLHDIAIAAGIPLNASGSRQ